MSDTEFCLDTDESNTVELPDNHADAMRELEFLFYLEIEEEEEKFVPAFQQYFVKWREHEFFIESPEDLDRVDEVLLEDEVEESLEAMEAIG